MDPLRQLLEQATQDQVRPAAPSGSVGVETGADQMITEEQRARLLREELIQVAAVAIATVQDLDKGSTVLDSPDAWEETFANVMQERIRQERKWGPQHHSIERWLTILMEEVGEAAQAALDNHIFPPAEVGK